MTKFLLNRPIAVGMSFVALLVFSVLAYIQLPISLLPDIDVPQLAIRVSYNNSSSEAIEKNVMAPLRQSMATMNGLEDMGSVASNEAGMLQLNFAYGSRMDLAYVEANEKVDRLLDQFPKDMPRPQVIRLNAADIPMLRLHIIPTSKDEMAELTLLTDNVLKKRLEQIPGISLVDMNGGLKQEIRLAPDKQLLQNYGLSEEDLLEAIRSANQSLGGIEVKDGQYQYFMRMEANLASIEDLKNLPISIGKGNSKQYIPLAKIASIDYANEKQNGQHLFNGQQAIVLNLHKQHEADMTQLMPELQKRIEAFRQDYQGISFESSQDQSLFLTAGINNLLGSLFFGGLFAFAVLFLFMGSARLPFIMGISLPSSLIISFLFFQLLGLSINIISLSGLALGLGMLIDNAIIVLENINRKRAEGLELLEACSQGVAEVRGALISSVLTTLAVFIPLIFLSGITGVLFYDQALSVAIILVVSLLVSFLLLPLLYKMFFKPGSDLEKQDSTIFKHILKGFEKSHHRVFKRPLVFLFLAMLLLPLAFWAAKELDVQGMPSISRSDVQLQLNWQTPISMEENIERLKKLEASFSDGLSMSELDAGISDYLMQRSSSSLQEAILYLDFQDQEEKEYFSSHIADYMQVNYPLASYQLEEAPNAFDLLFKREGEHLQFKWRPSLAAELQTEREVLENLPIQDHLLGNSLRKESNVVLRIKHEELRRYQVELSTVLSSIERNLKAFKVSQISSFSSETPIVLVAQGQEDFRELIRTTEIPNRAGKSFQLSNFLDLSFEEHYKQIVADASGPFYAIKIAEGSNTESTIIKLRNFAQQNRLLSDLSGTYFSDRESLQEILYVLMLSVLLLYFILAAQFESFWQPLLVLFTLPFGISGALFFLWIGGASLNVMSGIGMVVMLGIMVNDAILKIDTMNRELSGAKKTREELYQAIFKAGKMRLKPILMTSITTLLALCPVLILGGLGAELQKPLVLSVMGGLSIGTGTALFLVPLLYHMVRSSQVK